MKEMILAYSRRGGSVTAMHVSVVGDAGRLNGWDQSGSSAHPVSGTGVEGHERQAVVVKHIPG